MIQFGWKYFLCVAVLFSLLACQKDEIGPQYTEGDFTEQGIRRVYVLNEGNFNWGNASLSVYNPDRQQVNNRFFEHTNNYGLGDVVQSMAIRSEENRAYIVVNNSSKIEVVNLNDFTSEGVITGFNSPRYMAFSNANTAYVSDLYDNNIYKLNTETMEISKRIAAIGWTEDLWYQNNELYVLNRGENELWLLNTATDTWDRKFNFGNGLLDMIADDLGNLYLLVVPEETEAASIVKFNTYTKVVEETYTFPIDVRPQNIRIWNNQLYYMANDIFKIDLNEASLPGNLMIHADDRLFYNMEINPENGDIYVTDAVDYVQNGWVYVYNDEGVEKDRFEVNSIPGGIYFHNVLSPF